MGRRIGAVSSPHRQPRWRWRSYAATRNRDRPEDRTIDSPRRAEVGDVVLARRDIGTSYHLAVVARRRRAGHHPGHRGEDLFEATQIHVVLQRLLGLPTPAYHHHRLIRDDQGKRLAKRDDARALSKYRAEGATPQDIRRMVGL